MRLLQLQDDGDFSLIERIGNDIPPYAILSHTWGSIQDEPTFTDLVEGGGKNKRGYRKLIFCGKQAAHDGLGFFWVDTCCIDKSSSTELSEAIISMFRWYRKATKCYAYLSDVSTNGCTGDSVAFPESRWFTREWTLQELLAPTCVEFFSVEGHLLGDKCSRVQEIAKITEIAIEALQGAALSRFSIEERMAWASKRKTTREEDRVYSLLGIFDIHMPLLYGEGEEKAFKRLQKDIKESQEGIAATLGRNTNFDLSTRETRLSRIQRWLEAPDPSSNYQEALRQRQNDTGLWFLDSEQYSRWKIENASSLWLYGIPGCGKTILSSTILQNISQHCDSSPEYAVAYFYFNFNDMQKQQLEPMLRSLVCQLSWKCVGIPASFDALFSSHENGKRQPSLEALLEVMHQLMQQLPQVYVILDALDECAQKKELMSMLETMIGWRLHNMHLIVTSRREQVIERSVETFVELQNRVWLQSEVIDKDIQKYVRQRLSDDKDLRKWSKDAALQEEIETAIMKGSKGMFRWAFCQLDVLGKCRNRAMLRKSLTTLPPTLDATYERILCAITEDDSEYAIRILRWLAFSVRPLSIEEVAEVVAIDVDRNPVFDPEEVLEEPLEALDICSSLVIISTEHDDRGPDSTRQVVMLAHYSVKEYLLSDRIQKGQAAPYSMQSVACHTAIAEACLGYLQQFSGFGTLPDNTLEEFRLAQYSAEFWARHTRKTEHEGTEVSKLAVRLLHTNSLVFVNWIRIYDPDRPWAGPDFSKALNDMQLLLYYTALLGLEEMTKLLVDKGADVNTQGGWHGNALQAASAKGHKQIVRVLLEAHSEVNAQGGQYGNALQAAAAKGRDDITNLLLRFGADINKEGGYHGNALNAALTIAHENTVELLLKSGARVGQDARLKGAMHHAVNNASCTPSLVRLLLNYNTPADTVDIDNMTPLHYCVKFGHKIAAKQLLDVGVPVDSRVSRRSWNSAVVESTLSQKESALEFMLPASGSTATGLTPLHFAALTGNFAMTRFLLEHDADPNALSDHGETPLHLTLRTTLYGTKYQDDWNKLYLRAESLLDFLDHEEDDIDAILTDIRIYREGVLKLLLSDSRTSLTITDYKGESLLHCIQYGKPGSATLVETLVSKGADPFCRNSSQQRPLHFASRAGDYESVRLLLSLGAEVALTDADGLNAFHHAARSGDHETITTILQTEGERTVSFVALKDKCGQNALHHLLSTTRVIHVETLQLLLNHGVDGSDLDNSGISPLARFTIESSFFIIDIEICRVLLEIDGNASFVDHEGQNLGHLCARTADFGVHILELLEKHGVDLARKDCHGRTVLHVAATCGSLTEQSLHFLVDVTGLHASEKDTYGRTALQYATELALEDHDPDIWDRGRWKRAQDLLQPDRGWSES
ncbi:ankyrin repeat-containing domain protein [Lophiotrema nucula]|uniref:Ankyrin repeat-containing domain protein n=1 Tax=Lophiotrema nucula TaxID=690887 RepID=A0A6A5YZF9_9PLEO|nr:ankyrin repeat-containing domain protein [Lophiotrema nucula]